MRGTLRSLALVLLAATLGVGGAGARSLATTTLSVQVIGGGQVTSDGGQITCGSGATTCYFTTSATTGSVELTAQDASGWTFDAWTGCAGGATDNTCTVTLDGNDHDLTAGFTPATSPGTSTLTVHVTGSGTEGGNVSGGDIDCDTGETDCTSSVYTGSTLTLVEEPDDRL